MELEPKDIYEKLEFDKVLQLLENACLGALARAEVQGTVLQQEAPTIERLLDEVAEFKQSLESTASFPLQVYHDLAEDLRLLEVIDSVLSEEALQKIAVVLRSIQAIFRFFSAERKELYPHLYDIVREVDFDPTLLQAINQVLDEEGAIRPDASSELQRISRSIRSKEVELDKQFRRLIGEYRKKGWLSDSVESFRNGRRVLSVPSEHKRKIRGIIHDESTTGKTDFIAQEEYIKINNDLFDLEVEQRREIYRILKDLSTTLRPYASHFYGYQDLLIRYDLIQAKAKVASRMKANRPIVKARPTIGFRKAFHPLLLLKNQEIEKVTVPFDLTLFGDNRILMLSGPNAGGKSITMKAVGLLQLMLQAGMLIPVDEQSEMGIFAGFFADIGDQQSLEDDLSTYSSRLRNMRIFLEKSTDQTLVLIDEFGSGTDPKIGGAIAESILRELNFKKVSGLITTHYSNLKMFTFKTRGIVNGSMTFDKDSLSPTYELKVGRPGSSYAFEIARKSGLQERVLKYARRRTGKNEKAVDELLVDLQKERQELKEQLEDIAEREKKLQKLIKTYDNLYRDLDFQRKKLKLDLKERNLQQAARENREMERVIREIREEKNLEKAKKVAEKIRQDRRQLTDAVSDLKEEIYYQPVEQKVKNRPIKVGDFVKLRTGGATGKVESINKNKVVVLMGLMKMTTKLRDLQLASEPLDIRNTKGVRTDVVKDTATFESKMDLRGLSKEEALKLLENFVDKALMSNATQLRIVHGKGTGVLRDAVKRKLREYRDLGKVYHPEATDGGDGVTVVEIV